MAIINRIDAKPNIANAITGITYSKKRVAAYARVSTEQDEQQSSYEAQVDYYTRYIQSNPEWEFVKVYSDEGISGTNTKKREGFNLMIQDALDGKIDLILTKSISRFARNTVDTLVTVRKLKEKNIEVYFEKENIYTLDAKGEMLITIMSSLAQEESRSISENVTWGIRKSMEDGKISLPYKAFLGYEKGEDGLPRIVEEEAKIVRLIYSSFLEGKTYRAIADLLEEKDIRTPRGKTSWHVSTIQSILSNEKYKGDALLQKSFTTNFLTKEKKKNEGELPQYYIQNSHPAIISAETFDMVQSEMKRRDEIKFQSTNGPFAAKLVCTECGCFYGSKVWHSRDKYRSHVWSCNGKYKGEKPCGTPNLKDAEIESAFMTVLNKLLKNKDKYISHLQEVIDKLTDTSALEQELLEAENSYAEYAQQIRDLIELNAIRSQDQNVFREKFAVLDTKCKEGEQRISEIKSKITEQSAKRERARICLEAIRNTKNEVCDFDATLWNTLVETVEVAADKTLTFRFRDGSKLPVRLPE